MTKVEQIVRKALDDENVMGFEGLSAFSKAADHLLKKKIIPKGPAPYQALYVKLDGREYACCLFGDVPDDVWAVIEMVPHHDAYIGDTYKTRFRGHHCGLTLEEAVNE
jgi:hypothetical protein